MSGTASLLNAILRIEDACYEARRGLATLEEEDDRDEEIRTLKERIATLEVEVQERHAMANIKAAENLMENP